jgi:hypothetical protein
MSCVHALGNMPNNGFQQTPLRGAAEAKHVMR